MKKTCYVALLAAVLLLITAFPCPVSAETVPLEYPSFETEVYGINYGGTFILSMDGNRLLESGYAYGDLLRIEIMGRTLSLPLVENYSEVPARSPMCRLKVSTGKPGKIYIGINLGDMAKSFGLVPDPSDEDVSTSWHDASGSPGKPIPVTISMEEKEGYLKQYQLLQVSRSNVREDYPDLTDAEYANFRPVPCIRENLIYRSSSPIDPSYNRNREADRCLAEAGIRTVINMADSDKGMLAHEGFAQSAYSGCSIIALDLSMDFASPDFMKGFAEGMRFLLEHEGPYLVHCKEGKDRTGIMCTILEFLAGASLEDAKADYMATYYNYYGVKPGTEKSEMIIESMFVPVTSAALGLTELPEGLDYAACAEDYLKRSGLSDQEIADLKARIAPEPVPEPAAEPVSSWDDVLRILAGWYLGHFSPGTVPAAS